MQVLIVNFLQAHECLCHRDFENGVNDHDERHGERHEAEIGRGQHTRENEQREEIDAATEEPRKDKPASALQNSKSKHVSLSTI